MTTNHPDDGLRVVHDDHGSMRIVEPDGRTSVTVHVATKDDDRPFHVKHFASTQEVRDSEGKFVARTLAPDMAERICKLLIAQSRWEAKKAGT
jgi:hypothetical protein